MKNKSVVSIISALIISVIVGIFLQGNIDIANMFQPLGTIIFILIKIFLLPM